MWLHVAHDVYETYAYILYACESCLGRPAIQHGLLGIDSTLQTNGRCVCWRWAAWWHTPAQSLSFGALEHWPQLLPMINQHCQSCIPFHCWMTQPKHSHAIGRAFNQQACHFELLILLRQCIVITHDWWGCVACTTNTSGWSRQL